MHEIIENDINANVTKITSKNEAGLVSVYEFKTGTSTVLSSNFYDDKGRLYKQGLHDPEGHLTGAIVTNHYEGYQVRSIQDTQGRVMMSQDIVEGKAVRLDDTGMQGQSSPLSVFSNNKNLTGIPRNVASITPSQHHKAG